jgi:hypothetical protein
MREAREARGVRCERRGTNMCNKAKGGNKGAVPKRSESEYI